MSEADLAEVWARSLNELSGMQIEPAHRAWLQLTRPLGLVENTALIATPNEFVKEQLETRLRALITNTLSRELGRNIQLAVTVDPTVTAPADGPRPADLQDLADLHDEQAAESADATTGPLPRIGDDRTPPARELGPPPGDFGRGADLPGRTDGPGAGPGPAWAAGPASPASRPAPFAPPRRG